MLVSAVNVTDFQKKDELIHYAIELGCKAVYCEEYKGLAIQTNSNKQEKEIKKKIKELQQ